MYNDLWFVLSASSDERKYQTNYRATQKFAKGRFTRTSIRTAPSTATAQHAVQMLVSCWSAAVQQLNSALFNSWTALFSSWRTVTDVNWQSDPPLLFRCWSDAGQLLTSTLSMLVNSGSACHLSTRLSPSDTMQYYTHLWSASVTRTRIRSADRQTTRNCLEVDVCYTTFILTIYIVDIIVAV